MYIKFMFSLTVGLVGLSLVFVTLFETILREWDPVVDIRRWWTEMAHRSPAGGVRAEDILSELEGRRQNRYVYATRPPTRAIDRRREVLRDMAAAPKRAASPEFV